MVKHAWHVLLLCVVIIFIFWPQPRSSFVIDDFYTVVHNPLIKQPDLYSKIWTSRLFDAHQGADYIKLLYYRPVLMSSYIIDYSIGGLNPLVYKWGNLLIHLANVLLLYILVFVLFSKRDLALYAALLWSVLPSHEWLVRYITARGDTLQAFFTILSLISFVYAYRLKNVGLYLCSAVLVVLSGLSRESGYLTVLYLGLLFYTLNGRIRSIAGFSYWWFLIGLLPLLVSYQIIYKCGNIQGLHFLYFMSFGLCLWLAQAKRILLFVLIMVCAAFSYHQGAFWKSEESILRHTKANEWWPYTAAHQQLLMKYDKDLPSIHQNLSTLKHPIEKSMWFVRLGNISYEAKDMINAQGLYQHAIKLNPRNLDGYNNLAVFYLNQGEGVKGLGLLSQSLELDPGHVPTLTLLGHYYHQQGDYLKAKEYLDQALYYAPDDVQVKALLATLSQP